MRAVLLAGNPDLTRILQVLFELAELTLEVVATEQQLRLAAEQAREHDFLILDCSAAWSEDVDRCIRVATSLSIPLHIIHPREEFARALEPAAQGPVTWLSPDFSVLTQLDRLRVLRATTPQAEDQPERPLLSPREQEVLYLIAQGFSNKQIGRTLALSESTVKSNVASIKEKLDVTTRHELVLASQRSSPG